MCEIFDINMFEKSGSMGLKSSDSYIFYGEGTHSDNTSLYLIYSFLQKNNKNKSFISTLNKLNSFDFGFNIPFGNGSSDAVAMNNILDMFNLKQHVYFPTHKFGNTLDWLITSNE